MGKWSGSREQRDAARSKATHPVGSAEPSAPAVERYLRLEASDGRQASALLAHQLAGGPDGHHALYGHRSTGPLRQVHVVINGRNVAVTEDDIGVAELHLE
jgi:hypothetical protein